MSTTKKVTPPTKTAAKVAAPAKKAAAPKKDPAAEHLAKLRLSTGKRVKYSARTHEGAGTISSVYDGGRGAWVKIASKEHGDVTVRPSQVKLY